MEKKGYYTAFKATTLFGGVQVFRIIINMLKFKLVAIILGPIGFGLIGIYNSIITFVQSTTSLGMASSAVRDISAAKDLQKPKIVTALYRWFFGTGILGILFMVLLSPIISKWSFDNYNYVLPIIILSFTVFFLTLNNGELSILQGYRETRILAIVNVLGALVGLLVSLPMYLIWKQNGIVPSIIISAFFLLIISNYYVRKLGFKFVRQSFNETYFLGKKTLYLGIMLSLSAVLVSFVELIVKSYISRTSGAIEVGLYQAGWSINTSYIGLVLSAMSTDYFPRLSSIINDNEEANKTVSQQTEIAIIILAPLLSIMLSFLPFFVILLYSKEFLSIIPMTMIMLVGAIFKTVSWAISYVFLAKGEGRSFFINELIINIVIVISSLFFYKYWGLIGIGFAYSLNYFIYFLLVYFRARSKFDFSFSNQFWILFGKFTLLILIEYIVLSYFGYNIKGYIIGSFLVLINIVIAYKDLNARLNLYSFFIKKIKK